MKHVDVSVKIIVHEKKDYGWNPLQSFLFILYLMQKQILPSSIFRQLCL